MAKYKLEYLWLDGYEPVANLRSKTQIKEFGKFPKLEELPMWAFDGSSTRQAEGKSSDCILQPVAVYPDSTRKNGALVMCEVLMPGTYKLNPYAYEVKTLKMVEVEPGHVGVVTTRSGTTFPGRFRMRVSRPSGTPRTPRKPRPKPRRLNWTKTLARFGRSSR